MVIGHERRVVTKGGRGEGGKEGKGYLMKGEGLEACSDGEEDEKVERSKGGEVYSMHC